MESERRSCYSLKDVQIFYEGDFRSRIKVFFQILTYANNTFALLVEIPNRIIAIYGIEGNQDHAKTEYHFAETHTQIQF